MSNPDVYLREGLLPSTDILLYPSAPSAHHAFVGVAPVGSTSTIPSVDISTGIESPSGTVFSTSNVYAPAIAAGVALTTATVSSTASIAGPSVTVTSSATVLVESIHSVSEVIDPGYSSDAKPAPSAVASYVDISTPGIISTSSVVAPTSVIATTSTIGSPAPIVGVRVVVESISSAATVLVPSFYTITAVGVSPVSTVTLISFPAVIAQVGIESIITLSVGEPQILLSIEKALLDVLTQEPHVSLVVSVGALAPAAPETVLTGTSRELSVDTVRSEITQTVEVVDRSILIKTMTLGQQISVSVADMDEILVEPSILSYDLVSVI